MKYYAVIDTNVIVSSMLKNDSIPGQIVQSISEDIITPILNEDILNEYVEVLSRNKFGFKDEEINNLLAIVKANAIFLERKQTIEDFVDKDDIVFFEIVMSARSTMDAYLVTGNMKHYPIRSYVVTPAQMMEIIKKETSVTPTSKNS